MVDQELLQAIGQMIGSLEQRMDQKIDSLRTEMKEEVSSLRTEMQVQNDTLRDDILNQFNIVIEQKVSKEIRLIAEQHMDIIHRLGPVDE